MPYIFYIFFSSALSFKYAVLSNRRRYQKTMNRLHELRFVFAVLIIFSHCTNPFFSYAAYSIAVKQDLHIGRRLFLYFIRLWACLLCCLKTELSAQLLEKRSSICYGSPCFQAL